MSPVPALQSMEFENSQNSIDAAPGVGQLCEHFCHLTWGPISSFSSDDTLEHDYSELSRLMYGDQGAAWFTLYAKSDANMSQQNTIYVDGFCESHWKQLWESINLPRESILDDITVLKVHLSVELTA